jgi:hypothetical protein
MIKKIVLTLMTLFIGGCLPFWVWDYYAPSGEGGKPEKTICGGMVGAPEGIRYSFSDVDVVIQLFNMASANRVHLRFEIPEGKTVVFGDTLFLITECGGDISFYSNKSSPQARRGDKEWRIEDPLVGYKMKMTRKVPYEPTVRLYDVPSVFYVFADVVMPKSKCINVTIPSFRINGDLIKIPTTQFKKDLYLEFIVPLNC